MPTPIRENRARKMLEANAPALGMRSLTGGPDIACILPVGRADVKQRRERKLG